MKKSTIIINGLRAVFVLLAYQHIITPKAAMIPPGTGRTMAQGAKSLWHSLKAITKEKLKPAQA